MRDGSPPPRIRPARVGDIEAIVDYHHRCWLTSFAPITSADVLAFVESRDRADVVEIWHERLAEGDASRTHVATGPDDVALGHVMTHGNELVHLFIDPDHHGCGFGRSLLAIGERLIRDDGHDTAFLQTIVGNEPAIELYRSAGWTLTDELKVEELPNGSSYVEHVLRRRFVGAADA